MGYRSVTLLGAWPIEDAWAQAGLPGPSPGPSSFDKLPWLSAVLSHDGVPIQEASAFLAGHALRSRGVTSDSVRTYSEALLRWLRFVASRDTEITAVCEELLGEYRSQHAHAVANSGENVYATATTNLRVAVAIQFHDWGQRTGIVPSPLGELLRGAYREDPRLLPHVRVIRRLPRTVSAAQFEAIASVAREPYRLMFQWGVATGARRFEIRDLGIKSLPAEYSSSSNPYTLSQIDILRKGGRNLTLVVPTRLIEHTWWYIRTSRPKPQPNAENFVFLSQRGTPISRSTISAEFSRCAKLAGCNATLHHLRHTFATEVVEAIERFEEDDLNPLKIAQVLLGHSRSETSEIYIEARGVTSTPVAQILDQLFRWSE